ncbi:MAG: leucyl/phenylalanyl-tRNA--protein transferase [Pseudomonadota bacterium]
MYTDGDPDLFLQAYREGIFPMADTADALFYNFYRPDMRGQLSIEELHIPKKLRKTVRHFPYKVTINQDFEGVIAECAKEGGKGRETTWINDTIRNVFIKLHKKGKAHSVECWQDDKLVGGLYGLAIGKVYCGESMFSRATDASKIALVHLAARLWKAGFTILDTQFINDHLSQFGAYEIPQEDYEDLIETEMRRCADFTLKNKFPDITEDELVLEYLAARC